MPALIVLVVILGSIVYLAAQFTSTDAVGYVELKSISAHNAKLATLSVGSLKLAPFRTTPILLRLSPGTHTLSGTGMWASTYCELQVSKHRITTMTVLFTDPTVRCQCLTTAPSHISGKPLCT